MTEVVLWVGVYGEGTSFSVSIQSNATVNDLRKEVAREYTAQINRVQVYPGTLNLYFAREKNEDGSWSDKWLKSDEALEGWLRDGRQDNHPYVKMIPSWNLKKRYIQHRDDLGEEVIHILLELPQNASVIPSFAPNSTSLLSTEDYSSTGLGKFIVLHSRISVTNLLRQNSLPGMEFMEAMKQPVGFKIPILNAQYVSMWPDSFIQGQAEYGASIDAFLDHAIVSNSEMGVVSIDSQWLNLFLTLCKCVIYQDEAHESSSRQGSRPDTVIAKGNVLIGKVEAKASQKNMAMATKELTEKMADYAFCTFPRGITSIAAWTTCSTLIELHQLSYLPATRTYETRVLESYNVRDANHRQQFVVDLFKILKWVYPITEPNALMHLFPQVRTITTNGHYVTWLKTGLFKEFREDAEIDMEIIEKIYRAPLQHVERGRCNHVSVTITSIGQTLQNALVDFQGSRDLIIDQVKSALDELHSIGVAHCDVRAANVFVLLENKRVILGDLEYCRDINAPPPNVKRFPKNKHLCKTALELDNYQFDIFKDELAQM